MDPRLCSLLNLALFIETFGSSKDYLDSDFLFNDPDDGHRVIRSQLAKVFSSDAFQVKDSGPLGTHSIRKGAATYAARAGLEKDFVNRRGRWRVSKQQVDTYISTTLPYPDAMAAATLCGPKGACKYSVKNGKELSMALLSNVVPHCKTQFGERIASVLALPVIWALQQPYDAEFPLMPSTLRKKTMDVLKMNGLDVDGQLVERIPIHATGHGAQVDLIELNGDDSDRNVARGVTSIDKDALLSQQLALMRRSEEGFSKVQHELIQVEERVSKRLKAIEVSTKRIAVQPVVRRSTSQSVSPGVPAGAKLSKSPNDLYVLWQEYQFGVGGRKAAKDFTYSEKGQNRFAYSRRKVFWDVVEKMMSRGFTSGAAIDKIYQVYGPRLSVTVIIKLLRQDRKTGGHPQLR